MNQAVWQVIPNERWTRWAETPFLLGVIGRIARTHFGYEMWLRSITEPVSTVNWPTAVTAVERILNLFLHCKEYPPMVPSEHI
jgi:hypothetical protein